MKGALKKAAMQLRGQVRSQVQLGNEGDWARLLVFFVGEGLGDFVEFLADFVEGEGDAEKQRQDDGDDDEVTQEDQY
jgi:hypothetical protein